MSQISPWPRPPGVVGFRGGAVGGGVVIRLSITLIMRNIGVCVSEVDRIEALGALVVNIDPCVI